MVSVIRSEKEVASWIESLSFPEGEIDLLRRALARAQLECGDARLPGGEGKFEHSFAVASIVAAMRLDFETVAAALLLYCGKIEEEFGAEIASLVAGVGRFALIESKLPGGELEGLRKMLLAMVEDIRVVFLKLADQLQTLRHLAGSKSPESVRAAEETRDIYAPLANRLGIWQLKWELEDLAFRILEPETYKKIAGFLDEKRSDREAFIAEAISILERELAAAKIKGEISGRPKHIYSIYKKMQRKHLGFEEVYDVRAVRVLVETVDECYAVLGLVHNLWTPIPREFDDYIAKPKENGYRSLHTGVEGPDGRALEVQIRTFEMHQNSEMGVAAHWRYKEGGRRDSRFEEKIALLRRVLEWEEDLAQSRISSAFKTGLFQDTVYVLTPQGKVIDLPKGATPVDFAYAVHTDLGHRCRGAKVDGAIVPLTFQLQTGQRIEIIAAKTGGPSRDWLNPEQGFAASSRARAKIRQWFNSRNTEESMAAGREILERELRRQGRGATNLEKFALQFGHEKLDEFLLALGRGDITPRQIRAELQREEEAPAAEEIHIAKPKGEATQGGILIVGVDKLLTNLARCCKPVPPDEIIGFVSRGRGITVHRKSCSNVANLAPERLIVAEWGRKGLERFSVDIEVEGSDRPGLLRDISDVFSRDRVNVIAANTLTRKDRATMKFTLEVSDAAQLKKVLELIRDVPGIVRATRR